MPTIHLTKPELLALQKKLGYDTTGQLANVIKKVEEAVKAQTRLEEIKFNNLI
jgi:hypothetical protein